MKDDRITLKEALVILGLTKSGFNASTVRGKLTEYRSKEGWRLYDRREVESLSDERALESKRGGRPPKNVSTLTREHGPPRAFAQPASVPYSHVDGLKVFEALDKGSDVIACSVATGVHPLTVERIAEDYVRFRGTMLVTSGTMAELAKLPLEGTIPFKTDRDLLEAVKLAFQSDACESCSKRKRALCKHCAEKTAPSLKKTA